MRRWQHALVTTLGAACLLAAAAGATLATMNRQLQGEVSQRQQYLQQSVQLEGLYRELVRALAEMAARRSDEDLRRLLARHGISVSVTPPAPAAAPPPAEAKGASR